MTFMESLHASGLWEGTPQGMAVWQRMLNNAVGEGLAQKASHNTWLLGPEFWEAVEETMEALGGGGGGGGEEPAGPNGFEDDFMGDQGGYPRRPGGGYPQRPGGGYPYGR
jgi:hypothetical protein